MPQKTLHGLEHKMYANKHRCHVEERNAQMCIAAHISAVVVLR